METLGYILNLLAAFVIIPLTNWIKSVLPKVGFLPPMVALVLAIIFASLLNVLLKTNLDSKTLIGIILGMQMISQLGYEVTKPKTPTP